MEKNDNYTTLITRFWAHSAERVFNTSDCALYFYLLNTCNTLSWKQPFGQSDRHLSSVLGISVPTIRKAKCRLRQRNLIEFRAPAKKSKAFDGQTRYHFPCIYQLPNAQPPSSSIVQKTALPYSSPQFVNLWHKLAETPRWQQKPHETIRLILDKLKEFDEEFSIQLIEKAIQGGWSALIFPETKQKYQQWKKQQQNEWQPKTNTQRNDESQRRKAEIIRLANAATSTCHP